MIDVESLRDRIGPEPAAVFEVMRTADTDHVRVDPESIDYGVLMDGRPMPVLAMHYNKFNPYLPRWGCLVSVQLNGEESATFEAAHYKNTRITGDLKTVSIAADGVYFDET